MAVNVESRPEPLPALGHAAPEAASRHERGGFALLFGLLSLLVLALVLLFEQDPSQYPSPRVPLVGKGAFDHHQIIQGLMTSCAIGALGVLFWGIVRRWAWARGRRFQKVAAAVLVLTVFASGFSYFYARRGLANDHYAHRYDTFHYLMHPRYYGELNYPDLYVCALAALDKKDVPENTRVRDLRSYLMSYAGLLRQQGLCPTENFSRERWQRWKADLKVFTQTRGGAAVPATLG